MGSYYVRDFQDLESTLPEEFSSSGGWSFVEDGPGEIQQTKPGSATTDPVVVSRSVGRSFYSRAHGNGDSSFLELRIDTDAPGRIAFWRKIESEGGYDYYVFQINGVQQERTAGVTGWTRFEYAIPAGSHVFRWSFSTDGSVLIGFSGYRLASIEVAAANPNPTPAKSSSGGGGGGGGSRGTGNMLGAFALGSTMLGADAGSGGGGGAGGGSGVGNMLGGFQLGQTMLGADPAGGGDGDSAPINVGAIFPVTAAVAGLANVVGAFATFIYPVAASVVGTSVVQNAYLNAPWALSPRYSVNGTTNYFAGYNVVTNSPQEVKSQSLTYTVSGGGNGFRVEAQYRNRNTNAVVFDQTVVSGGYGGGSYSQLLDAGAGNYVAQVRSYQGSSYVGVWDWFANAGATTQATLFSPISLRASVDAGATVAGDISVHILDGDTCSGSATVTGDPNRRLRLASGLILSNATVTADLINVKDLFANVVGDSSLSSELVLRYLSAGESTVTGDASQHTLTARNRCSGTSIVTANMRRNEGFQGDGIGDSEVTEKFSLNVAFTTTSSGSAAPTGDLTYPAPLGTATSNGTSTVTSVVAIYNLNGSLSRGEASVTGHVRYLGFQNLQARPSGAASTLADFRVRGRITAQTSAGSASIVAMWNRLWYLAGEPSGTADLAGDYDIYTIPAGPIMGESTVVAETVGAFKFAGRTAEIKRKPDGEPLLDADGKEIDEPGRSGAKVTLTYINALTSFSGGTSQGISGDNRGRLTSFLQDFPDSFVNGHSVVLGQVLISALDLKAWSRGGRLDNRESAIANGTPPDSLPLRDAKGAFREYGYNDTLVSGFLPLAAAFEGVVRAEGRAEFVRAILLLNDSGLIFGDARVEGTLDYASRNYKGRSNGFSKNRGQFDFARDIAGTVTDAYAGVGKWFPNGFHRITHFDYGTAIGRPFRPVEDTPEHAGKPGNAERHGGSVSGGSGMVSANFPTIDSHVDGHIWDGVEREWMWNEMAAKGLNLPDYPELWDPDKTGIVAYDKYPAALRRKYALLTLGQRGTWMVDTRGPGFLDKAMRADSVGEARFDEPHSTVDMDLELKSSMRGRINTESVVTAAALLLSIRTLTYTGNVTALRTFTRIFAGNLAKSPEALVSITRTTSDLIAPVNQTNALYV